MARLDSAANEAIKLARRMAKARLDKEKPLKKPKYWKGKKVIPLVEFRKKEFSSRYRWQDYFPNEFVSGPPGFTGNNELSMKEQGEWRKEFLKFMKVHRDPDFGKYLCRFCILNPENIILPNAIREPMMKLYHFEDGRTTEPCNVINEFRCPYDKNNPRWEQLDFLSVSWQIVQDAITYFMRLSGYKQSLYLVDFNERTLYQYKSDGSCTRKYNIEGSLDEIKIPRIEIKGHNDMYYIMKDRGELKKMLEEYAKSPIDNKIIYHRQHEFAAEHIKNNIEIILQCFSMMKDVIKLEDLRDYNGKTVQDIENEKKLVKDNKPQTKEDLLPDGGLSGTCMTCNEFANIRCKNCNVWMCVNHWREHARNHGMKEI